MFRRSRRVLICLFNSKQFSVDGRTTVFAASSEPTRGEKDLISWTNFERLLGMPGLGSSKCSTQALHEPTLMEKSSREILDINGTDTKREICNTIPFPGSNYRSPPYRKIATMGAAAAVCVQKRGGLVCNDVEQSLHDPIRADVGSPPQSEAECWLGHTLKVTGTGPLNNKEVQ